MVLVDFNGLAIGSIMGQLGRGEELSENLVKHIILNNLRMYRKKYPETEYNKIVICCDSQSWRKDIYPQYKANRATAKIRCSICPETPIPKRAVANRRNPKNKR